MPAHSGGRHAVRQTSPAPQDPTCAPASWIANDTFGVMVPTSVNEADIAEATRTVREAIEQ